MKRHRLIANGPELIEESGLAPAECDPLITEKQLSAWLGISLPTLRRLRSNGQGPRFVQLSERRIAYRRWVVEQWLKSRTCAQIGELDTAAAPAVPAVSLVADGGAS